LATASYSLNPNAVASISEATRKRVQLTAAQLGYLPNSAGATLRKGHSNIALLVLDSTAVVQPVVVRALVGALALKGFVALTHWFSDTEQLVSAVWTIQPSAVILLTEVPTATRERLLRAGAGQVVGGVAAENHRFDSDAEASKRTRVDGRGALTPDDPTDRT